MGWDLPVPDLLKFASFLFFNLPLVSLPLRAQIEEPEFAVVADLPHAKSKNSL
jgi:hypothetical protein